MSTTTLDDLATKAQSEVARQMQVCNACRYCEGLCAVFPAMELRRDFTGGDVDYLANLCHNCGACYYDCQYAPPHEFAINVPVAMAALREESYARYAWPGLGPGLGLDLASSIFARNGVWITWLSALAVMIFVAGFVALADYTALFASGSEAGAFYRVMPHNLMVAIFGSVFLFAIFAMIASVRAFWRAAGRLEGLSISSLWQALLDSGRLRYLDGGGMGCMNDGERPTDRRRLYHHATFYGFMLCFAATASGTLLHYFANWPAPYPWWSLPVVLGTLGGIGLIIGPLGLLHERARRDEAINPPKPEPAGGMGAAFLWMLLLVGATGLLLLVLRATSAMGLLLAIHLGFVFALFLSMPYGKFVHGIYRFAALVRHAHEQRAAHGPPA